MSGIYIGTQVRPGVCSVGIQCSTSDGEPLQTSTNKEIQCSLLFSAPTSQDISEDSESELSQCSSDQLDLDTSAYTLKDESSS